LQDGSSLQFSFDKVHGLPDGAGNTQADIFADIQDIVLSALQGLNGCIMAYGQTGKRSDKPKRGKLCTSKSGADPQTLFWEAAFKSHLTGFMASKRSRHL